MGTNFFDWSLMNWGYQIEEVVLNAKDFGVPQSRKRLFMLCSKSRTPIAPTFIERYPAIDEVIDKNGLYKFSQLEKPGRAREDHRNGKMCY